MSDEHFRSYAKHHDYCVRYIRLDEGCNCGLDKLLAGERPENPLAAPVWPGGENDDE